MYLDNLSGIAAYMAQNSSGGEVRTPEQVKDAFARIFYKEMLKQTFSSQNSILGEEEDSLFPKSFNQEMMLDKLAEALAKSNRNLLKNVTVADHKTEEK